MRFVLNQRVRQGRCILFLIGLQLIAALNLIRMLIDAHAQVRYGPLFQAFRVLRNVIVREMNEVRETAKKLKLVKRQIAADLAQAQV